MYKKIIYFCLLVFSFILPANYVFANNIIAIIDEVQEYIVLFEDEAQEDIIISENDTIITNEVPEDLSTELIAPANIFDFFNFDLPNMVTGYATQINPNHIKVSVTNTGFDSLDSVIVEVRALGQGVKTIMYYADSWGGNRPRH